MNFNNVYLTTLIFSRPSSQSSAPKSQKGNEKNKKKSPIVVTKQISITLQRNSKELRESEYISLLIEKHRLEQELIEMYKLNNTCWYPQVLDQDFEDYIALLNEKLILKQQIKELNYSNNDENNWTDPSLSFSHKKMVDCDFIPLTQYPQNHNVFATDGVCVYIIGLYRYENQSYKINPNKRERGFFFYNVNQNPHVKYDRLGHDTIQFDDCIKVIKINDIYSIEICAGLQALVIPHVTIDLGSDQDDLDEIDILPGRPQPYSNQEYIAKVRTDLKKPTVIAFYPSHTERNSKQITYERIELN